MDDATRRKRSYAAGYLLNLAGKPLPLSTKREPVAYLYNGVRLPKLPEWDREMYPYAAITGRNEKFLEIIPSGSSLLDVYLFVSAEPFTIGNSVSSSDESYYLRDLTNSPFWTFRMGNAPTEWENGYKEYYGYESRRVYDPGLSYDEFAFMWTNHDIKYLSQVAVAASDPIPVYE